MHRNKTIYRPMVALLIVNLASVLILAHPPRTAGQQPGLPQLEEKLQQEEKAIQKRFADGPGALVFPTRPRERLARWQDELGEAFARAAAIVDQIINLNPANVDLWRERRDTLLLYATPVGPPGARTVFGSGEVQKRARLVETPLAAYPDTARVAKAKGEVRLRLVLAADGTVKYVFPIKPAKHGLTEATMAAARQIKFEPAIKSGQPVSQFLTLVYEFKKGSSLAPYVPQTVF